MILFNLKCAKNHGFDAWFRDNASYDAQVAQNSVSCPVCGNRKVEKAIMAPRIAKGTREASPSSATTVSSEGEIMRELRALRRKIEENCDYVGDNFAEEARKIHYGETDPRGIYGESTPEEARELTEEGIEFANVPWVPRHDS